MALGGYGGGSGLGGPDKCFRCGNIYYGLGHVCGNVSGWVSVGGGVTMTKRYIIADIDNDYVEGLYDTLDEAKEAFEEQVDNGDIEIGDDTRIYEITGAYEGKRSGVRFVKEDL